MDHESNLSNEWVLNGKTFPRSELKFLLQMGLLYIVSIICLINISIPTTSSETRTVCISLLSSAIGIAVPSPVLHTQKIRKLFTKDNTANNP